MKEEIKWMTLWLMITSSMALLSLSYTILNYELDKYGITIINIYLLFSIIPYFIWKYTQIFLIQKQTLFMYDLK